MRGPWALSAAGAPEALAQVLTTRGEAGVIEGRFGQSGKFKVRAWAAARADRSPWAAQPGAGLARRLYTAAACLAGYVPAVGGSRSTAAARPGLPQVHFAGGLAKERAPGDGQVVLAFKKFVFEKDKHKIGQ
jgi:hypothetical protein